MPHPSSAGLSLFLAGLLLSTAAAPAQDLKRDVPAQDPGGCPAADAAPQAGGAVDRAEAARLVAAARNAAILGDHGSARELLGRAARLDPDAEDVAYLHARALEQLGDPARALEEYCRYLRMAADAPDAEEVRERVARLAPPRYPGGLSDGAVDRFRSGVDLYDRALLPQAELAFTTALREAPDWAAAYYNRAVVRAAREQPDSALADLERVLRLTADPAEREALRAWAVLLRNPPPVYSPGTAFAAGLLPGGGHFYSGRPIVGLLVLAGAGGAAAFGATYEVAHIECRSIPVNDVCPPEQVHREWTERPYLIHGIAAAAAATLIGAYDAYRGASRVAGGERRRARAAVDGVRLSLLPAVVAPVGGRLRVQWIRLGF